MENETDISDNRTEIENTDEDILSRNQKPVESETESVQSGSNTTIELHLNDKPDSIFEFVIHLQNFIKKQEKIIKKLRSKLKRYRSKKKVISVSTQTGNSDECEKGQETKSFSEEIKEAAENAMHQTGFVYEATSGMYYDYNTGYYYNAELGLYYDGNSGTYLLYNNETKTYDFHSQVDIISTSHSETIPTGKRKHQKQQDGKRVKTKKSTNDEHLLEEGECSNSDNDEQCTSVHSFDTDDEQDCCEISKSWPPCMRIIIKETGLNNIKIGSLFMVTCDGGTIGREGNHSILIPDLNVSKHHAKITFDRDTNNYTIVDLGSQNGTLLNGKRLSVAKQESNPQEIVHGSIIQIGSTKLLCHIHEGQKTCGHCEPGLIQAESTSQQAMQLDKPVKTSTQYRKELRRLRKKFGLECQDSSNTELAPGYTDRAQERRKNIGSHASGEKTQVASVNDSIATNNKGFKMLAKMGWSEGQSLGKDGTGVTEPIPLISNDGKKGLGSSSEAAVLPIVDRETRRKLSMWRRTQQRYLQVQEVNLDAFKNYDSED